MSAVQAAPVRHSLLLSQTDKRWFEMAAQSWRELLVDHANCEKKAASTALSLIFTYADDAELATRMSRLAREELRHFEQVQKFMLELQVPFKRLSPSRYADGLRRLLRRDEPGRLLDLLLCGALIEARSCERFIGLVDKLQEPLASFYRALAESEARHQSLYLRLADQRATQDEIHERLSVLAEVEADLAISPDAQFRFHSGTPISS